jgi:hypothetical protein
LRAIESLEQCPLSKKDSYITAFVKREKILDPIKDPRMIQGRGARYNIELGNYLKSFEEDLYKLKGTGALRGVLPPSRCIVKGMNPAARAALLHGKWSGLRRPVQLALDCSRFDGHCSKELLQIEHGVYNSLFNDPYLQRLLAWQLRNKCFTKANIKYECDGRRMSGDMNTALGNCVLMVLMMAAGMRQLHIKPHLWDIADDGDDCALFVESSIAAEVTRFLPQWFGLLGHDLKIESTARKIEDVTLCDARIVRVGGVRTMITRPARVIGKARVHTKCYKAAFIQDYVATVGQCLLAVNSGVPVLQAQALAFRRAGKMLPQMPGTFMYKLRPEEVRSAKPTRVTDQAREDFSQCFGVAIQDQLIAERWFNNLTAEQLLRWAPPREVPLVNAS